MGKISSNKITSIKFPQPKEIGSVLLIPNEVWDVIKSDFEGQYTLIKYGSNYRFCFGILHPEHYFKYKMLLNKMAKGKSAKSAMMYELSFYLDVGEKKYSDHYKINDTEVFDEMGANVSVDISWAYNKAKRRYKDWTK